MTESKVPKPPAGTRSSGRRLWSSILEEYELEEHEVVLLKEMVRCVDLLDELAKIAQRDGTIVPGPALTTRVHPALVEARQARITLARLSAALRLPAGEEGDEQQGARRPQRRVGARGVYGIRGAVS